MSEINKEEVAKLLSQCVCMVTCFYCKAYFTSAVRCLCGRACCAACWCGICALCGSQVSPTKDVQTRMLTKKVETMLDTFGKCFQYDTEAMVSSARSRASSNVANWLDRYKNDFSLSSILENEQADSDNIEELSEQQDDLSGRPTNARKRSNQANKHTKDTQWSNVKRMRKEFSKPDMCGDTRQHSDGNKENESSIDNVATQTLTRHPRIPFILKGRTQPLSLVQDDVFITIKTGNTKTAIFISNQVDPGKSTATTSADTKTVEERGTQTEQMAQVLKVDTFQQSENIFSEEHFQQSNERFFTDTEDSDGVVEGTPVQLRTRSTSAVMSGTRRSRRPTPVARELFNGSQDVTDGEDTQDTSAHAASMALVAPVSPIVHMVSSPPVVAGSCLSMADARLLEAEAARRGWRYSATYCPELTHLVLSVDDSRCAARSVKYMLALAAGRWLVDTRWLHALAALPVQASPPDESEFEVLDYSGAESPRLSRCSSRKLFEGISFFCFPPFTVLNTDTLHMMIESSGGRVVEDASDTRHSPMLLLAEPPDTPDDICASLWSRRGVIPVNIEWLLSSLGNFQLLPLSRWLLRPRSTINVEEERIKRLLDAS